MEGVDVMTTILASGGASGVATIAVLRFQVSRLQNKVDKMHAQIDTMRDEIRHLFYLVRQQ